MSSFLHTLAARTRVMSLVGVAVLATVAALTLTGTGTTATAAGTTPSGPDDALAAALVPGADATGDRAALRKDLQAARALKGQARADAIKAVRAKALAGGYGTKVEHRAQRRDIRADLFRSLLPEQLQTDLAALKAAPADQRKAMRQEIRTKALAGDYGAEVKAAAEKLKALRS